MNRFVGYTLEGLLEQNFNHVWVMLGLYPSLATANTAASAANERPDLVDTRILSYYRDQDWWKTSPPNPVKPPAGPTTRVAGNRESQLPARAETPTIAG